MPDTSEKLITIREEDLVESLVLAMSAEDIDKDICNSVIATLLDAITNHCDFPRPMADFSDYERQQETAAQGEHIRACMEAIIEYTGADCTLASLQRRAYEDTDAGISLSFQLVDGTFIYSGAIEAKDASLVNCVRRIGFSSIAEGTDREVDAIWLDLLSDKIDSPEKAVAEYGQMQLETNDKACAIWKEENGDDSEEEYDNDHDTTALNQLFDEHFYS